MIQLFFPSVITLLLFISKQDVEEQTNCQLRKNQDSIKVYTCPTNFSKFKTVKAVFTINSTYSKIVAVLLDIEKFDTWQYKTKHARVLKKLSENEVIYYSEVEAPWPIQNRDIIVQMKITQDSLTKWVNITGKALPEYLEKNDNLVRVPVSHSTWTLKAIGADRIQAEYVIQIDPGGSLPAWFVNIFAAEGPYETFRSFRKQIHLHAKLTTGLIID